MTLKTKFQVALLLIATLSIGITSWQSFEYSRSALESITFARLTANRESKKQQIENYFHEIRNHAITLAQDPFTIEATKKCVRSFQQMRNQTPPETIQTTLHRMGQAHVGVAPPFLREYYGVVVGFHRAFQKLLQRFRYSNILIINIKGEVIYSAQLHRDFAENIITGPLRASGIARAFTKSVASTDAESALLVDFSPYEPIDTLPASFVAASIFDGAHRVGVLVIQLSIHDINTLMTSGARWEEEGLGRTGETYIVGDDFTMRNDSRFFIEDSAAYFRRLQMVGANSQVLAHIRSQSTSILIQRANTEATRDALAGNTNTRIIEDYRGVSVLSSYTPLKIPGVHWVILAEIDSQEALASVALLRERLVFVGLVLVLLAGAAGVFIVRTGFRPLVQLTTATELFGKGDLAQRAKNFTRDEIGNLAQTFNRMASTIEKNTLQLHSEIAERRRTEKELRLSQQELRNLSAHLQSVREEERKGVAREIHDELGQALSSLRLELALMKEEMFVSPGDVEMRIRSMTTQCDSTIKSMKRIITQLRPQLLDDLGLVAAIEWQSEEFQHRTGVPCRLTIDPDNIDLDADISTAVFRILQETLTNVAQHSHATVVTVDLHLTAGGLRLTVRDNGKGIDPARAHDSNSFGLLGMRERARYFGGTVSISSERARGTTITVFIPITKERAGA